MRLFLFSFLVVFCSGFCIPAKPKVLIIGDSISIGYFPFVKEELKEKAELVHNTGNAQATTKGLSELDNWLGKEKWDVIQFNWGLWDIAYRNPASKTQGNRDKLVGKITCTPDQYRSNMEALVTRLKKTGAKLIFVTTSYVPMNDAGRYSGDEIKYNAIAIEIMQKNGIEVNDLYAYSKEVHAQYGLGIDDVHYTKDGYKELSRPIINRLKKLLE